jgi:ATP-grasp domain, R2K clade family 3
MYWIIQDICHIESKWAQLKNALTRFDIPHSSHKVIPFVGDLVDPPDIGHKNVICMGAYSMRHYARAHQYNPGVFDLEPFDFTVQLKHWGDNMLNASCCVTTMKDAPNVITDDVFFIRPVLDSKSFAGQIMDKDEFMKWQKSIVDLSDDYGDTVGPDTVIQIAKPVKIFSEYRFFVVGGKIATASMYKLGSRVIYRNIDNSSYDSHFAFAYEMICTFNPLGTMCIDIAETADGFKIVEINTLNSSGFYDADMQKLVIALEEAYSK